MPSYPAISAADLALLRKFDQKRCQEPLLLFLTSFLPSLRYGQIETVVAAGHESSVGPTNGIVPKGLQVMTDQAGLGKRQGVPLDIATLRTRLKTPGQ